VGAKDPVLLMHLELTQIIAYASGKYRCFGETLDIGIGNFIDKFARHTFAWDFRRAEDREKAKNGNYIDIGYSIKGMDVSFSGMQTKCSSYMIREKKLRIKFFMQETAFAMLLRLLKEHWHIQEKKNLCLAEDGM